MCAASAGRAGEGPQLRVGRVRGVLPSLPRLRHHRCGLGRGGPVPHGRQGQAGRPGIIHHRGAVAAGGPLPAALFRHIHCRVCPLLYFSAIVDPDLSSQHAMRSARRLPEMFQDTWPALRHVQVYVGVQVWIVHEFTCLQLALPTGR